MIGRRQPRRDYASGQCLAMLRREGRSDRQRWEGRTGRATTKNMKTKAKGDGKRRKRENIVKKMAAMFISPYLPWVLIAQPLE